MLKDLAVLAAGELSTAGLRMLLHQPTLSTIAGVVTPLVPQRSQHAPSAPSAASSQPGSSAARAASVALSGGGPGLDLAAAKQKRKAALVLGGISVSFTDMAVVLPHGAVVPAGHRADGQEVALQVCAGCMPAWFDASGTLKCLLPSSNGTML